MLDSAKPGQWNKHRAAHLLNRAGFGGPPKTINRVTRAGMARAIDYFVDFKGAPDVDIPAPAWTDPETIDARRREFMQSRRELNQIEDREERDRKRRQATQKLRREQRGEQIEMTAWWLKRMQCGPRPLEEKLTLFWHGHFATSVQKVRITPLMFAQNETFRQYALGNFKTLVHEISRDPAMMLYLDTNQNRKGKPNENFARELMELFTLGEGNYSEQDIKEAARAFTGYSVDRIRGKFRMNNRFHDDGSKRFFGKEGNFKGDDVVAMVLERPECPKFICRKLWEFFAYENPSDKLVDALAAELRAADFEIRPVLRKIFASEEFYSDKALRTQIKSPVQFIVQMARQLELDDIPPAILIGATRQLGQLVFMPPNVAGWEGGKSWINTNTLLTRYNVAGLVLKAKSGDIKLPGLMGMQGGGKGAGMMQQAAERRIRQWKGPDFKELAPPELRKNPAALVKTLTERLFHAPLTAEQRKTFEKYALSKKEKSFTDGEIAELLHLMMSTPYYQLT